MLNHTPDEPSEEKALDEKCSICDKVLNQGSSIVCSEHILKNAHSFLFNSVYFKLKERTNDFVRRQKEVAVKRIFYMMPSELYMFGRDVLSKAEELSPDVFRKKYDDFYESATLCGYAIQRMLELFPDCGLIVERHLKDQNYTKNFLKKSEQTIIDHLEEELTKELDLLHFINFYINGFFSIALDKPGDPKKITILPQKSRESSKYLLEGMLYDSNQEWFTTFDLMLHIMGTDIAVDRHGRHVRIHDNDIETNFKSFRRIWEKHFGSRFEGSFKDYENMKLWLKWVVSPSGYNFDFHILTSHFDSYKEMGMSSDYVRTLLNQILKEPSVPLKGSAFLHDLKTNSLFYHMMLTSTAYSLSGGKNRIWFTPAFNWFQNLMRPLYLDFAIENKLVGKDYEEDIENFIDWFTKGFEISRTNSLFGLTIRPGNEPNEGQKQILPQLIAKNYPISATVDGRIEQGEIDFIILSNHSLYLIEAKSINLDENNSQKYLKNDATHQCRKYSAWAKRTEHWNPLLAQKGIDSKDVRAIRTAILSSSIFPDLIISDSKSGEEFAVVQESILFSCMVGILPEPRNDFFPWDTRKVALPLRSVFPRLEYMLFPKGFSELEHVVRSMTREWFMVLVFNRQDEYVARKESDTNDNFPPMLFLESYISDTSKWILPSPLKIGESSGWRLFVGTQISEAGHTFSCIKCKIAVKYYESSTVESYQTGCPNCGNELSPQTPTEIIRAMSEAVLRYKIDNSNKAYGI